MVLLIAAAAAASVQPAASPRPVAAAVQARATIRILAGVSLSLGSERSRDGFIARESVFRSGGVAQPARLIEFQ